MPCCLDHAGDIKLGNLFTQTLDEVFADENHVEIQFDFLNSEKNKHIWDDEPF